MVSYIKKLSSIVLIVFAFAVLVLAQETPETNKPADEKKPEQVNPIDPKNPTANYTVEQVVESTIVVYAFPGGRPVLDRIRKTTHERGTMTVRGADGKNATATYQRWIIRGDTLDKDKQRLEQAFPATKYSLMQNNDKVSLILNDSVYPPSDEAEKAFEDQIYHGLDALLRYKENGSKIELAGKEKDMGVEYYLVDVTDKQSRKTRFYVSTKRFRVMMLDYEDGGKKYRRKFYDYNYAQGTLVPHRTVLYEDGKVIEDSEIGTITFGQKVDDSIFPAAT